MPYSGDMKTVLVGALTLLLGLFLGASRPAPSSAGSTRS